MSPSPQSSISIRIEDMPNKKSDHNYFSIYCSLLTRKVITYLPQYFAHLQEILIFGKYCHHSLKESRGYIKSTKYK